MNFKNGYIEKLTEGIVNKSASKEQAKVFTKWEKTGLLEGLKSDYSKKAMALVLENQAKEVLREATTMAGGDVEGFASVAFPVVRRVFGETIANDLVSVQPLSMPNGLVFFLDFTYTNTKTYAGATAGESIYGGGKVGKEIARGIDLTGANADKGMYNLNQGYTSPSASYTVTQSASLTAAGDIASASWASDSSYTGKVGTAITSDADRAQVQFDPDVTGDSVNYYRLYNVKFSEAEWNKINLDNLMAMDITGYTGESVVRRLTTIKSRSAYELTFVIRKADNSYHAAAATGSLVYTHRDAFANVTGNLGAINGTDYWYLEAFGGSTQDIPEIDLKIDSIPVTAISKKLRTKWTPEVGQDLDAYHNIDVENELTGIMSEQVALEIDREILVDLIKGATAAKYYWSRQPGKFVERATGLPIDPSPSSASSYPDFTGNVSEWYQTLIETMNDVSAQIHRKVLRGGANFVVTSPEVANVLEMTNGFRASNLTHDSDKGSLGVFNAGSTSKKWDVWVDPMFPRNVILIGRRGSNFLESGYVYCPYVPLMMFPLVYFPDNFTPTKGLMTRYAKLMTRSDMYGLVIVQDLMGAAFAA